LERMGEEAGGGAVTGFCYSCCLLRGSVFRLEVGGDRSSVVDGCELEGGVATFVGFVDACFPVLNEILTHLKMTINIERSIVQRGTV